MLDEAELRRLLHELREPIAAFAINIALLEGSEQMSTAAQASLKTMHRNIERMSAAINAIDFGFNRGVQWSHNS